MISVGIYLLYTGYVKLEHKTILRALPVFVCTLVIAMIMNEIAHTKGMDDFNMFYISPYAEPHLPVYSDVQRAVAYPWSLLIYIFGFTAAGYLMLAIGMGIRALGRVLFKKKTAQTV